MSGCLSIAIRPVKRRGRCPSWCGQRRVPSRPRLQLPKRSDRCRATPRGPAQRRRRVARRGAALARRPDPQGGPSGSRLEVGRRCCVARGHCRSITAPRCARSCLDRPTPCRRRSPSSRSPASISNPGHRRLPLAGSPGDRCHAARHDEPAEGSGAGRARSAVVATGYWLTSRIGARQAFGVRLLRPDADQWAQWSSSARVVVRDAGFTEIPPDTQTAIALWHRLSIRLTPRGCGRRLRRRSTRAGCPCGRRAAQSLRLRG